MYLEYSVHCFIIAHLILNLFKSWNYFWKYSENICCYAIQLQGIAEKAWLGALTCQCWVTSVRKGQMQVLCTSDWMCVLSCMWWMKFLRYKSCSGRKTAARHWERLLSPFLRKQLECGYGPCGWCCACLGWCSPPMGSGGPCFPLNSFYSLSCGSEVPRHYCAAPCFPEVTEQKAEEQRQVRVRQYWELWKGTGIQSRKGLTWK